MSDLNDDLINTNEPDDLIDRGSSIQPDDFGTKAYIPPDIDLSEARLPEQSTTAGALPVIPNNFDGGIFSINHYRRYFNLNTTEFFTQIGGSINILSKVEDGEKIGDLYGPIWVTATVIFILFFSNTSSNLLVKWVNGVDEKYEYNFNLLTGAMSLLYGYTILIPLIFYIITVFYFKFTNFFSLTMLVSIYGYANSVWVPAALLGIVRGLLVNHKLLSSILKWVAVLGGGLISGASIGSKLYPVTRNSALILGNERLSFLLLALLLLAHAGFIIAVKVLFFGDLKVV